MSYQEVTLVHWDVDIGMLPLDIDRPPVRTFLGVAQIVGQIASHGAQQVAGAGLMASAGGAGARPEKAVSLRSVAHQCIRGRVSC